MAVFSGELTDICYRPECKQTRVITRQRGARTPCYCADYFAHAIVALS